MAIHIVPFSFESHEVRVVVDDSGEPLFVAKDLVEAVDAVWVGSKSVEHVPEEWRMVGSVPTIQGTKSVICLTEQGMYFYLIRSDKPKAMPLQKKVAGEILPSIRKTGKYEAPSVATRASFKDSMFFAKEVAKALRLSETSKLRMYKAVSEEYGVPLALLPSYSSEGLTRSLTDLLTQFGVGVSAVQANKVLLHLGILEELERPSRKSGGVKKFKSITQSGSRYGKNETSPENPNETQPRWYAETAEDLVALIKRELETVA